MRTVFLLAALALAATPALGQTDDDPLGPPALLRCSSPSDISCALDNTSRDDPEPGDYSVPATSFGEGVGDKLPTPEEWAWELAQRRRDEQVSMQKGAIEKRSAREEHDHENERDQKQPDALPPWLGD
jgi:hypothetical protein